MTQQMLSGVPIFVSETETTWPVRTKPSDLMLESMDFTGLLQNIFLECDVDDLPQGDFVYQDFLSPDVELLAKMVAEL